MRHQRRTIALLLVLLLVAAAFSGCAEKGEKFPAKAVTVVVPYSAGGTTDLTGRALAKALEAELGVTVVVENKAGASGAIGTEYVAASKKDGYTLLLSADSLGTQRVMGLSDYSYGDFEVLSPVTNDPKVIVVAAGSPYETLDALLDDLKARPGKVRMSYTGPGGSGHIQSLIYEKLGYTAALTAYPGGKDCIVSVLGGDTDFTNSNYSTVRPYVEAGQLRILAVSEKDPIPGLADVPTVRETVPGSDGLFRVEFTPLTLLAPKGVPADVLETLKAATARALRSEAFLAYCDDNSLDRLFEKYDTADKQTAYYAAWESIVSWLLWDAGAAQRSPEEFDIPRP